LKRFTGSIKREFQQDKMKHKIQKSRGASCGYFLRQKEFIENIEKVER